MNASTQLFRFTLTNSIVGALQISEPGGWQDAVLSLERNEEYHSLVEYYEQPMTFYGQSNEANGGLDFIRAIENTQGPDAQIFLTIEISDNGGESYDNAFEGLIDIPSVKELDFYKAEYGVIRNDFWQKFINRKSIPVSLSGATSVDGESITPISSQLVTLTSQKIRKRHYSYVSDPLIQPGVINVTDYITIDLNQVDLNEVKTKYDLTFGNAGDVPVALWEFDENGTYTLDFRIEGANVWTDFSGRKVSNLRSGVVGSVLFYVQKNNEAAVAMTATDHTSGSEHSTSFTYSTTTSLKKGDSIRIYGDVTFIFQNNGAPPTGQTENLWIYGTNPIGTIDEYPVGTVSVTRPTPSGVSVPTYFSIVADTITDDTTVSGFNILDAAKSICNKIISEDNCVTSNDLGPSGCFDDFLLARGLNIRGYDLDQKPFFMSFDTWWGGANPIFNLGLGYTDDGQIEIEKKERFYDPAQILQFDYVNMIERSYDEKSIVKSIEIGYDKWSAESASGIDDPQSKRTYSTRFKTVGQDVKITSKFIAASLAIEQTRRNRIEIGKDWRLDDDVFIIALNDTSPQTPELDENFSVVSNLLNSTTRYNIRLSVAYNFKRWRNWLNGCLSWYTSPDNFKFSSGEGNFDMSSTLRSTDCEYDGSGALSEKQDIPGGNSYPFLFKPVMYEFEYPLSWGQYKAIREDRKKAIGVSRTSGTYVSVFIQSLKYQITKGKAKFVVKLSQATPIQ